MRVVQRAQVVLLASQGMSNTDISIKVGMHWNRVAVWRRRYAAEGLRGLEDEERSGRPPIYGPDEIFLLLRIVSEAPPSPLTRWTVEAIASAMGDRGVTISSSQTWRICTMLDLKPWEVAAHEGQGMAARWEHATELRGMYLSGSGGAYVVALRGHASSAGSDGSVALTPGVESSLHQLSWALADARRQGVATHQDRWSDRARFPQFLSDVAMSVPEGVTLQCYVDDPELVGALMTGWVAPERFGLQLVAGHRAWLQRLELLLTAIERTASADSVVVAMGTAHRPAATPAQLTAAVKAAQREGRRCSWLLEASSVGLAAAV